MKNLFTILLFSLFLTACGKGQEATEKELSLVKTVTETVNQNDYSLLKPYLTHNFTLAKTDPNTSYTTLYAYLNFKETPEITEITIRESELLKDSIISLQGKIYFKGYKSEKFELKYKPTAEGLKITHISAIRPHKFSLTTRATYNANIIFGENRVENIENLNVLDYSQTDFISGSGYQIYYDKVLKKEGEYALNQFIALDQFLNDRFKLEGIEKQNIYLTQINSSNTITVGKDRFIPWTFPMFETDSINMHKLSNKIGNTFSHEIVEETMVHSYKLRGYKYRWFNDGISEYMAYHYAKIAVPDEALRYFYENRLEKAEAFKQDGNLLDWRGNGPIKSVDQGKLYGERFIHFDNVGQYGRAFKFFKDTFENQESLLIKLLAEIKSQSKMTPEKLLEMLSNITGKDAIEEISKY